MKREIDGYVYDTANARVIASHASGRTHVHRSTSLYRSPDGRYFTVEEQETHGLEGILLTPLTEAMAREWLYNHGRSDLAGSLFKNGRIFLRIEIDSTLLHRIDAAAEAVGMTEQAWVVAAINAALAGTPYAGDAETESPAEPAAARV